MWNREFTSVESAYQWRKCMHHGDMQTAEKMLSTRTGLQAKHLSKSIQEKEQLRAAWDKQRYSLMYALVAVKYRDPTLRKRLLDTGWVFPVAGMGQESEGYWGALTYSGQAGQNMLGHILMRVREFIRLHQTPPTATRWPDVTRDDHKTGEQSTTRYQTSSSVQ